MSAQAADSPAAPRALGLAVVVFAATVIVAVGAFLITQRVKHLPTPIARFEVGPIVKVPGGRERIAVQLASPDTVEMTIVDGGGRTVATVARGIPLSPAQTLVVRWDGREGSNSLALISGGKVVRVHAVILGPLVRAGEYHAVVRLEHQGRSVPLPAYFVVERR